MSQKTRTIRVSMEIYDKLCELGKTNDTFTSVLDRLLRDNDLTVIVTEEV